MPHLGIGVKILRFSIDKFTNALPTVNWRLPAMQIRRCLLCLSAALILLVQLSAPSPRRTLCLNKC